MVFVTKMLTTSVTRSVIMNYDYPSLFKEHIMNTLVIVALILLLLFTFIPAPPKHAPQEIEE